MILTKEHIVDKMSAGIAIEKVKRLRRRNGIEIEEIRIHARHLILSQIVLQAISLGRFCGGEKLICDLI